MTSRQIIEAKAKQFTEDEGVLRMLRREWVAAPVANCEVHPTRVASQAVTVMGTWYHQCPECASKLRKAQATSKARTKAAREQAALGGMRAQTQHRQ
jgi:hypothetical protein